MRFLSMLSGWPGIGISWADVLEVKLLITGADVIAVVVVADFVVWYSMVVEVSIIVLIDE